MQSLVIVGRKWFDKVNGNKEVLWRWAEREGIALTCTAADVSRKRDL